MTKLHIPVLQSREKSEPGLLPQDPLLKGRWAWGAFTSPHDTGQGHRRPVNTDNKRVGIMCRDESHCACVPGGASAQPPLYPPVPQRPL